MNIPKKIKIGGLVMQVIEDKNLAASEDRYGECDHMRGHIVIDENQPQDHKEVTLIHEIIEEINSEHELKLEHNQITSLASCFHQVIKDNFSESKNIVVDCDTTDMKILNSSMKCKCGGSYQYVDTIYRTKGGSIVGVEDVFKCDRCDKKITLKD